MRSGRRVLLLVLLATVGCAQEPPRGADLQSSGVLARYDWSHPAQYWRLPVGLDEVSGLAPLGASRVLAHDDNVSTLWLMDYHAGLRVSALPPWRGGAPLKGDFEDVSIAGGHLYLLGSPGVIYQTPWSGPEAATRGLAGPLEAIASGVEGRCNFEGLAALAEGRFLLACKYPRRPRRGQVLLYRIEPGGRGVSAIHIDVQTVLDALGVERLRPSALAWLDDVGRLLILAGKERVILETDAAGRLLGWRRLPRRYHRQAEGLAVAPGGDLLIADEADGRRATLSRYAARPVQRPR